MTTAVAPIIDAFDQQRSWCEQLGSPLYARLLAIARDDIEEGGVVAEVVGDFPDDPLGAALSLRFMGGVHRIVLMGVAPKLARHYPSVGGEPAYETVLGDFLDTVHAHKGYLRDALSIAPQTNEVGRSAALLLALGTAAAGLRGSVRLLEIGAAAGLNLHLDRYRYEFGSWSWGSENSPVTVAAEWRGDPPRIPAALDIIERRGCDVAPIDVRDEAARLRALSFVWPDQVERFDRTRAALQLAANEPVAIDRADAADWLDEQLATEHTDTITVVQQSVMWQYVDVATQQRIDQVIEAAGRRATSKAPLARSWFDAPSKDRWGRGGPEIALTTWPGGERRTLGFGQAHGAWIEVSS